MAYDATFYDEIRAGCQESAAAVAPLITASLQPTTVVDVGCGEGWWGEAFERLGCTVTGLDGAYVESSPLADFVAADLTEPIDLERTFDLAVCLEVAEHLPESRAGSFVSDLCSLAPVVLFSAAIPGQGGTGHLNEQWPGFWVDHFEAQGYTVSGALRWEIWDDERVENWYRQNLLVAAADPSTLPEIFASPLAAPWPVVHPVLYDARRS